MRLLFVGGLLALALPSLIAQETGTAPPRTRFDASGFTPLFDGRTLEGWTAAGGRYDGKALWTVEEGVLTGREGPGHAGGLLYTRERYQGFLLSLDAWIDYPFDSGIFLNMVPRAEGGKGLQITLDYRPDGEVGGIYADGWLQHNAEGKAKFRRDAWNRCEVRCSGHAPRVEFWLNGELLTDFTLPAGSEGFAREGRIGLQVHGGSKEAEGKRARFRDIRILELPPFDPADFTVDDRGLLTARDGSGWRPLFNRRDLAGWEPVGGAAKDYVTEDGILGFRRQGGDGYLRTRQDYRDFRLRLDFDLGFMCNSGVFLRGARDGSSPAYSGCEIQILDDFNWEKVTGTKLQPYQFTGGLYGSVPPAVHALRPPGLWNTYEITYRGTRIKVELNGRVLYDVDTLEVPGKPFAERAKEGFIGLQRHAPAQVKDDVYVRFRNLFVHPL